MLASWLQRLALASELSRLDFSSAPLVLESNGGQLRAAYQGAYGAGCTMVLWTGPSFCIAVNSDQFKAIVGLYDPKQDVDVTVTAKGMLSLRAGGQAAALQIEHDAEPWVGIPEEGSPRFQIRLNRGLLASELELASLFCAGKASMPILTGIRLSISERVTISASDSVAAVYTSKFDYGENIAEASGDAIIAPSDLLTGLRLMEGDTITLTHLAESDRLVIDDGIGGLFYTAEMGGNWPDFSKAVGKLGETHKLTIPSATIKTVATASAALGAGSDIELVGKDGSLILRTLSTESGAFALQQSGGGFIGVRRYDGGTLSLATRLADVLEFHVPTDGRRPTRIVAGNRQLFLVPKYTDEAD